MNREDRITAVSNHVRGRRAKDRMSDKGELWIDHLCLFHDDNARSATWQPDTGVYHCWAENRTFTLEDVERAIGLSGQQASPVAALVRGSTPRTVVNETLYNYTYPDGSLSHVHVREDYDDGTKEMPFRGPEWTAERPKEFRRRPVKYWPIYDESFFQQGQIILVVEGEKKVAMVNAMEDTHDGLLIRALTVGSASETEKLAPEIATRLQQLEPSAILLWPDNDAPGIRAMTRLHAELERQRIPHVVVDPMRYNMGPSQDVADYIFDGGSLAKVISDHWQSFKTQSNGHGQAVERLKYLVETTVMVNPSSFIFPNSQSPMKLDIPTLEAMWSKTFSAMPAAGSIRELRAKLIAKSVEKPVDIAFRLFHHDNAFWWRPQTDLPCYQVTAEDITMVPDPPSTMVLVPRVSPRFSTSVDLNGDYKDFYTFCQTFHLDRIQEAIILTWLVCAFTGRKTPILLLKGGAGTGKTTLATYLCALVDPDVPTLSAQKVERDIREFVRTAQRHPALLLDNVGTVKPDIEDALSKLVTGEAAPLRVLYEDVIETIHLQRAIAVTTTTWDITKGDLASRMWPIEPKIGADFLDEDDVSRLLDDMVPRLRGFAMKMCQTYYRKYRDYATSTTPFRIGGRVLQTLGYDVAEVYDYTRASRARVIAEGEPWLDAIVDLWAEIKEEGPYHWSPVDLCGYITRETQDEISPKALSNFIRPRQALFPNYGFKINWGRNAKSRFYQFSPSE